MKDWNSTETKLHSWQLRQPSARLEEELFGSHPQIAPARRRSPSLLAWQNGWAAGLAGCAMLAFTLLNMVQTSSISGDDVLIPSAAISNASYAASFASVQHNCLSAPILGWTNDGELPSSNRSLHLFTTNHLLP